MVLRKVMKKSKVLAILVFCVICFINIGVSAKEINASLQFLSSEVPERVSAMKIKDGRLLLYSAEGNTLFDPKTNKFKETASFKTIPMGMSNAILLSDGRVLFLGPYTLYPSTMFGSEIYHLIHDDFCNKKLEAYKLQRPIRSTEYSRLARKAWQEYKHLPEEEKEKIYLPYLKKNPELYKKYQDYLKKYEHSMYGQIYDPKTETIEYTKGKVNIRRDWFALLPLSDGKVLIVGGRIARNPTIPIGTADPDMDNVPSQLEIFDPETETFHLLPVFLPENNSLYDVYEFKNGDIYLPCSGLIYNPENHNFTKVPRVCANIYVFLKDDQIAYMRSFPGKDIIRVYNPRTAQITMEGELLVPRDGDTGDLTKMSQLSDGNILVSGGINEARSGPFMGKTYENRLEIFNPKTGKSQLLNKRYRTFLYSATLLDDGRVFLIGESGYALLKIKK